MTSFFRRYWLQVKTSFLLFVMVFMYASEIVAQNEYGDLPVSYEKNKDGTDLPAVHSALANLRLGITQDLEITSSPVSAGTSNNNPNGDGADEDAISLTSIQSGVAFSLPVAVNNPAAVTRYLYGWLDFNGDGKFQVGEAATVSFATSGATTQTLTWTNVQTEGIAPGVTTIYLRLRLSTRSLLDFTTAASGGALIDERSIGNGAASVSSAVDHATISTGEVEDYQLAVLPNEYGDLPVTYEQDKDGLSVPAVHAALTGLRLGAGQDLEAGPASVVAGSDNNTSNGDGTDEDGVVPVDLKKGVAYSVSVSVNNPTAAARYLYGWIDFNGDGHFQLSEAGTAVTVPATIGASTQTLSWTGVQTATLVTGAAKVYLRVRLSTRSLADFTASTLIDERSIGNGAASTTNAINHAAISTGEVEDYQLSVVNTYDFGDVPASFETDKDNNPLPAIHTVLNGLGLGTLIDEESAPASVTSPLENNATGDNSVGSEDEDGVAVDKAVARGGIYSISVAVNNPTATTRYLYGWLDLNGDGKFQVGEVCDAVVSVSAAGATTQTLTWSAAKTTSITAGVKHLYMRVRLSSVSLIDFTASANIDERSTGNGASAASGTYSNAAAVPFGEVEDYSLTVDDYDFGDVPASYDMNAAVTPASVPARHIAVSTRRIGALVDFESAVSAVAPDADNNSLQGDGEDEDGFTDVLPVIVKGAPFSFTVPFTVSAASYAYAWIDFNGNGHFEAGELAYTLPALTTVSQTYNNIATGSSSKTFYFSGTQTNLITGSNIYVRIRLSAAILTDATGTLAVDERSIGDGLTTGVYGAAPAPKEGEVEDYRFAVTTDMDYGDVPATFEINRDGLSQPARHYTTDNLYLGQSYVLEAGSSPVSPQGADNNNANGDGEEEDGLIPSNRFIRTNIVNNYIVALNNTTGATATLYAWIDLNNDGHFTANEAANAGAGIAVANGATTATVPFTLAQLNTITAAKVYMRIRLLQQNPETGAAIADYTTGVPGAVLDERSIADGLATGIYTSATLGEVEDYQLTVVRDFGDAPASYESSTPASQSNAAFTVAELTIGSTVDYELTNNPVASGTGNNDTNGDGSDEDGITTPQTYTVGSGFTLAVPINTTVTGTKYLYGWIDFNGDGIFNENEVFTASASVTAGTTSYFNLAWTAAQTNLTTPAVITAGKTYARLRLSGVALAAPVGGALTIDERSFGTGTDEGEIEDYQFEVSNLYDYGDAPLTYEVNNVAVSVPARQAVSATLKLGIAQTDKEAAALSVAGPGDNNGINGDGADEDGITGLLPVYDGINYRVKVSVLNNSGAARTLYGWIDFNGNGRFEVGEVATFPSIASLPVQQNVYLNWTAAQTALISGTGSVYMRLRISEGALADGTSPIDERAIGDGLSTGIYGTLYPGEVEDYQLGVTTNYDFGDAPLLSYELNKDMVSVPARQSISDGSLFLGNLHPDNEPVAISVNANTDNNGTNGDGADEDGAAPGIIVQGGGYTLNVIATNNTGAAKILHGWIDFNNNGKFENTAGAMEYASVSVPSLTDHGVVTLNWTTAQTAGIATSGNLYMRLRLADATLADLTSGTNATLADERSLADGLNTGIYGALGSNGEIEDYRIEISNRLDYGDAPASYDNNAAGVALPARQISNAAIQLGNSAPDVESGVQNVASGTDNNSTNGDGDDEDGIDPATNAVTVNTLFTLPVRVTNTTGTARPLRGWIDINNNGQFEPGELATTVPSVATGTVNGTVNLVWTAAKLSTITNPYVYLRLRLADAAPVDDINTTVDERAIADGASTGVYTLSTRGEVEDYRLVVNPFFDYGDAPVSYERNALGDTVPLRHKPTANLYLGSSYDTEVSIPNVASGADNNGTNGDGADDDGITTSLPALVSGTTYSVPVDVFKNVAGTGTLHAWMDFNGDGLFSVKEYTSIAVTGSSGAQTVMLRWPTARYSGAGSQTFMRLRFTSTALADNATTVNVDERSVGDGLSTGIYGTAIPNGEAEDYTVPIDVDAIAPTDVDCGNGLGIIDAIQAGFHATIVRPASGGFLAFGQGAHGNGNTNLGVPAKIESGTNGYNFDGIIKMVTLASASTGTAFTENHQYFALTTAGLYAWGNRGIAIPTTATTNTVMQPVNLPVGVGPAYVKMIDAGTSYVTDGTVTGTSSISGSLALLTNTGEVWIRSSTNTASIANNNNAAQGDGDLTVNNADEDWHRVQTAEGVPLTGMLDVRTTGRAVVATNGSDIYTWGTNVFLGNGSVAAPSHYAAPMQLPAGIVLPIKKADIGYGNNLSASYYILDNAGAVYVLGNNNVGQLGIGTIVTQTSWIRITLKNEEPDAAGNQPEVSSPLGVVTQISTNNHDSYYGHLLLITSDKRAYHAGSNAGGGGLSGTVSPTSFYIPTAVTMANGTLVLPGKMVLAEAGGHIGVLAKEGSDRYGYVGHTVSGSDGCNSCTADPSEYDFSKTSSTGPLCGIRAFDFGDLDNATYDHGDSAKHEILYAQESNPLKIGAKAADSDDGPQFTATGADNNADGDDADADGDDEDAFTTGLPEKMVGQSYSLDIPVTNKTGGPASLYGFIDWDGNGVFTANEAAVQSVATSATAQTITLTWADPGPIPGFCMSADVLRSFVRLRLSTSDLEDDLGTPDRDERGYLTASDGEMEDYYLDWVPAAMPADLGNLPAEWPVASATMLATDLSVTDRVWLGQATGYPDEGCVSNVARNDGFSISQSGEAVMGAGTASSPFMLSISGGSAGFVFNVTVNGNGAAKPVYWAVWFDANNNGSFTDAEDVFTSGITTHGSPVTTASPFTLINGGTNAGALAGKIRVVATAVNTSFSKSENGQVNVTNGEVEDYYVEYPIALPVSLTRFEVVKVGNAAQLKWETSSEQNTVGFTVERSTDDVLGWKNIGNVSAAGNSNIRQQYQFTDNQVLRGKNYYRLKTTDKDGEITYSQVRSLSFGGTEILVSPNPAQHFITVSGLSGNAWLQLLGVDGRILQSVHTTGTSYTINTTAIAKGTYLIKIIQSGAAIEVRKFIKE